MRERVWGLHLIEYRKQILYLRDVHKMTFKEIAKRFRKDHSTIIYHYQAGKAASLSIENFVMILVDKTPAPKPLPQTDKYAHLFDEPVSTGRSYEEYVKKADRHTQARAQSIRRKE